MRADRIAPALMALITTLAPLAVGAVASAGPDCGVATELCVDAAGKHAEYPSIQAAVDAAGPGTTVWVFDGDYAGFRVRHGGRAEAPLRIVAVGEAARIVSPDPGSGDAIYIENASHLVLEGFVVEGAPGYGIAAHDARPTTPMRDLVVRNNTVLHSRSTNIYMSQVSDSVIEGNIAIGSLESHGIYLANAGSDNTVLRGNNCYDNAVNGIHFNGDQADTGDGLQWLLRVEGNVIHHNGANGLNMDGVQYSTISNNLVFDNGHHGLRAYAIDAADGPRMLTIVNNTFVGNAGWAVKLTQDGGRHTVFNNILLSRDGALAVDNPQFNSERNLAIDRFSLDGERTVIGLRRWQAAGYGAGTRSSTPAEVFRAPARSDYRLRAGSPALDLGAFILNGQLAPEFDLEGHPRPVGRGYDAGAFEGS